ncbi:MAG: metalloregulator ArsR/SmtB family transcription factor [Myxococcota bacterium]
MSRASTARSVVASANVFAALGDATRLELVSRLSDGRRHSIAQLAEGLDMTRQGVTKHLRTLERAGVVSRKRSGRESHFSIRPESIRRARDYLARASAQWDEAIERLRAVVEE